jgi:hypothetical protein
MNDTVVPVITAVGGLLTGLLTFFGVNYWKSRNNYSNNSTKVQLEKIRLEAAGYKRIEVEYEELKVEREAMKKEIHGLTSKLESVILGIKILFGSYVEELADKPRVRRSMEDFIKLVDV